MDQKTKAASTLLLDGFPARGWHRGLWLSHVFGDKEATISRIERWADRKIEQLLISRPMAFAGIPISSPSH